jgi:hypothetical protein
MRFANCFSGGSANRRAEGIDGKPEGTLSSGLLSSPALGYFLTNPLAELTYQSQQN